MRICKATGMQPSGRRQGAHWMGRMAARMGDTSYPIVSTYPPRPQKSTCAALSPAHSRRSWPTAALGQGIDNDGY